MEGSIGREHVQIGTKNNERIGHRVKDGLGIFTFVDCLIDTCPEGGHIGEREYGFTDLAVSVWRYSNNE
jgi:hypothetical protein